ncbi:head GIN domain-containing protein [Croceicoccus ponticola]|nr:head GIN domain-containing protein [Croceicoccus ponticola]
MSIHIRLPGIGKAIAAVAGLAIGGILTGCNAENVSFGDVKGVPLSELDTSGAAPTTIALMGPDTVKLKQGETLTIDVEGSDEMIAAMRFALKGDTLGILRSKDAPKGEHATVLITMPAPESIVVAGSGRVETQGLADKAEVTIAGSGTAVSGAVDIDKLKINIAGSGTFRVDGKVRKLTLSLAGSGEAKMKDLQVEKAEVNIAGSGKGQFRSDGTVAANIMGSGEVRVIGRAKCEIHSMGSGKLVCEES